MRFLFIGSRFTLHASFPHSVTLMQLRFTSFVVINLRRDLHPQVCAHAGRTKKNGPEGPRGFVHIDSLYDRGSPCSLTVNVGPGAAVSCVRCS